MRGCCWLSNLNKNNWACCDVMGLNTTDWVAFSIFGAGALVGTFGRRLPRVIGLAAMALAFAGLVLSLNHHEFIQGREGVTNSGPNINTESQSGSIDAPHAANNQKASIDALTATGPQRLDFDAEIGEQLASKLPAKKSVEIMAVGSRADWNIAGQYAEYLKAKGFDISFLRSSEIVPPPDHKIIIRDDPATSPIIVIIAPSAL
ncbi:MAG: hypothetical protein WCD69_14880 [Xanthobacteraceae bacterium]